MNVNDVNMSSGCFFKNIKYLIPQRNIKHGSHISYSTVLRVLSFEKINSFLKFIIFMKIFSRKPDKAVVKILRSDFEMKEATKTFGAKKAKQ